MYFRCSSISVVVVTMSPPEGTPELPPLDPPLLDPPLDDVPPSGFAGVELDSLEHATPTTAARRRHERKRISVNSTSPAGRRPPAAPASDATICPCARAAASPRSARRRSLRGSW